MTHSDLQALRIRAIEAQRVLDAALDAERKAAIDHQQALAEILGGRCERWYVRADVAPGCSMSVILPGRLYVVTIRVRDCEANGHGEDLPTAIECAAAGMVMPDEAQDAIRALVGRLRGEP